MMCIEVNSILLTEANQLINLVEEANGFDETKFLIKIAFW